MSMRRSKQKGRRCVTAVRELILKFFTGHIAEGDLIQPPACVPGEDLIFSPAARQKLNISVECKNQEALNIWSALSQVGIYARRFNTTPVLFFQRNHSNLYAALPADDVIQLFRDRHDLQNAIRRTQLAQDQSNQPQHTSGDHTGPGSPQ